MSAAAQREEPTSQTSELNELRPTEMVGNCAEMREVNRIVVGVAKAEATVLVLGESGTGKELVAREIHKRSRRAQKPLVTVNCAAIPYELVESELFGHTRGAFTSAVSARAGLFEAANGGTIFLDEIGDLPIGAQVKLLRALESGEIKPVGSDTVKHVDVRVIAATNANLKAAIAAGTFRHDLFYRLNVVALKLPSLRERGEDILQLAHHFLRKFADLAGRLPPRLSLEASSCLLRYDWPGNVRELEHAIERAMVLDEGDVIGASSLPPEIAGIAKDQMASLPPVSRSSRNPPSSKPTIARTVNRLHLHELAFADAKKRVVAEFTDAYLQALLNATNNNVSEAARRSGLDRSNFRRLIKTTR